ncbi:hypothetical protein M0L20_28860 [Spirosoma sp. RP8]|uniref:Peptidase U49 n=1 Tax=Spirosoma liriopis TaxID=2937440 RepID=A0ABT0HUX8_9BACT|nr:phage exclusion protein Lit family protein [Spirosoma liriopis]MCK8495912.1 hypothetical protein [Spirosoma liriopis]
MFRNTNNSFYRDLAEQVLNGKLNNKLNLLFGEEPINIGDGKLRTPRINTTTRRIELHETFLSYLWSCTYAVFINYVECVDYPTINKAAGREVYAVSQEKIDLANEMFNYARYLIVDFRSWDKEHLPNPEVYQAEDRNYVEQTNIYYTEAVKFILCHEFVHVKHHLDFIDNETSDSIFLLYEQEADDNAIDMMKAGMPTPDSPTNVGHKLAIELGVIFGILSMFFFKASSQASRHPCTEDRLTNALERLELNKDHVAWGIACVGLRMWDDQFGLHFNWTDEPLSYRDQYFDIVSQIKSR